MTTSQEVIVTDVQALKERINLVDLAGRFTSLHLKSGDEHCGPCPKCGGEDRFVVRPAWAFCRQCWIYDDGSAHDCIGFMRWVHGCSFVEAVEMLGGDKTALQGSGPKTSTPKSPIARVALAPSAAWQARAREFIAEAQANLWKWRGAPDYLKKRGLAEETCRAAGLGFNPFLTKEKPALWGIEGGNDVWLPQGWVIPCIEDDQVWYVKFRRTGNPTVNKYPQLRGSKSYLYGGDTLAGHSDAVLCEGEFDTLLLRQQVGAICGVCTLGSASGRPGDQAIAALVGVRRLWTAYDTDKTGQDGATRMGELSARIKRLPWPDDRFKDITDLWRAGHNLAAWIVPNIGPTDPARRRVWLRFHLDALQAGDTAQQGPRLRLCLALLADYSRLCAEANATNGNGETLSPDGTGLPPILAILGPLSWREMAAPDWAPVDLTGLRRFFEDETGRMLSVT